MQDAGRRTGRTLNVQRSTFNVEIRVWGHRLFGRQRSVPRMSKFCRPRSRLSLFLKYRPLPFHFSLTLGATFNVERWTLDVRRSFPTMTPCLT
jgi:hypothetical protein